MSIFGNRQGSGQVRRSISCEYRPHGRRCGTQRLAGRQSAVRKPKSRNPQEGSIAQDEASCDRLAMSSHARQASASRFSRNYKR
jgi:hypothetical protein